MLSSQILIKLPWLVVSFVILYFCNNYFNHKSQIPKQSWHYHISHNEFQHHGSSHLSTLQLLHDGEGHYEPMELTVIMKNNQHRNFLIDDLNHTHIDQKLSVKPNQIKHAVIKSKHPINFNKQEKVRLLQSIYMDDKFILVCGKFFAIILPLIRNILILGVVFNEVDLFLPLIMTTESIMILAFLDNSKHYLTDFYKEIFNSRLDLFTFIRLNLFSISQNGALKANHLIGQYGFSQSLIYNISGEFVVTLGVLMAAICVKIGAALFNFQKLRQLSSKLRGVWNGFLFCMMPRVLTFSSFSVRQISFATFETILYPSIGIAFLVAYIVYFIQLFSQIRQLNSRKDFLEEFRNQIGLVTRIDYKLDFNFDCIKCSNLFYPIINFLRLLVFFLPIGAAYDFTYWSFGGVIVSQLIYVMFSVSSSGFVRNRDGVVYPLCDLGLMVLQLAHIAVGLAENVMHSEVSVIAEKVFFSLLLAIYLLLICSLAADVSSHLKLFFIKNRDQNLESENKELKSTRFKRTFKVVVCDEKEEVKTTIKTQHNQNQIIDESLQDNNSEIETSFNLMKTMTHVRTKIRKVRNGKII